MRRPAHPAAPSYGAQKVRGDIGQNRPAQPAFPATTRASKNVCEKSAAGALHPLKTAAKGTASGEGL